MSLPEETRYDCSAKVKNKNDHLMVHWKMWTPATHVYLTARQNGKSSCIALDRSQVQSLRDQLTDWLGDGSDSGKLIDLLRRVYDMDLADRHLQPFNRSKLIDEIELVLEANP